MVEEVIDEQFLRMNRAANLMNLTELEKKHLPHIGIPVKVAAREPFDIEIEVGRRLKHPNEPGHYIQWIELYADDVFLARTDLTPQLTEPKTVFTIRLDNVGSVKLRAVSRCNLHGLWEVMGTVTVLPPGTRVSQEAKFACPTCGQMASEEVVKVLTPPEAQTQIYERRLKGEEVRCVFCDKPITNEEIMAFWLGFYPAHLSCVHKQLDIDKAEKGQSTINFGD